MLKEEKLQIIKKYGQSATNTGSTEVQIAFLTHKINHLNEHLKKNIHDNSSYRGLYKMVGRRKRFLKYLEQHDVDRYRNLISQLGLRK